MTESRPDTSDMAAVHKVFRSSLASAPQFVASAQNDERLELVANYYANVMALLETHHETEEELLFPLLIERVPDQSAGTVQQVLSQHAEVVGLTRAVNETLTSWQSAGDSARPETVRVLLALDAALSPHLDQEEAQVVPLAAEYLTVEEWGKLPGHSLGNFTGDKLWLILGLVRENFSEEQRVAMLEHMSPESRETWERTGEASFNGLISQLRQTTGIPR
jgi:hypothetical protein